MALLHVVALLFCVKTCYARNVFVVGGSSFMGKLFVERSAERGDNVWMLNRGHSDPTFMASNPRVHLVKADRFNSQTFRAAVRAAALSVPNGKWDAVVDFTAFQKNDAVNALAAFFARTKHYIYVSTISAYQIVTPDGNTFLRSDRRPREVLETDMLPPPGPAGVPMHTYKKRLQAHSYGAGKYLIERKLLEAWDKIRFPFTSIRLPEVVGPGADDRHWFYQVWLATGLPVQLHPATEGVKFRMVYRDDAVRAIEDVINAGSDAHGEAYNIAQAELIDMPTYLQTVAEAMGRPAPEILYAPDEIR